MAKPSNDHKPPQLTAQNRQLLQYFNEHMMQLVQQIRAVLIAAKIKPEDFHTAFLDEAAQDDYFIKVRAIEHIQANKQKAATKDNGISPEAKAQADAALKEAIKDTFNNNERTE